MFRELGHAIRRLARSPGQTVLVILILGLGIGAATSISSVVNGVLLRPLPFPHSERLLTLWQRAPGVGVEEDWFSIAQYFDIREQASCFDESAILFGRNRTLTGDGFDPERLSGLEVSSSFFDLTGIRPSFGRRLEAEDDTPGSGRKALLSSRLFERRFGADKSIVGQTITLDGTPVQVIGILPDVPLNADLFPTLVTIPVFDLVLSLPNEDPQKTTSGSENFNIVARMRAGLTLEQVEANLLTVAQEFVKDPGSLGAGLEAGPEFRIGFVPLLDQVVGGVRLPLLVLMGATVLLLVIACANVANLLLTSAAARRREFGIRSALGAPRLRMIGQAMIESILLALAGGLVGLALADVGISALHWASPQDLPRLGQISLDLNVLLFSGALCLGSSLLFGLGPAFQSSRVAPVEILRDSSSRAATRSVWRGGASYLVIVQVSLSLVLACGAILTVRTYQQLQSVHPGFDPEGVLTFRLSLVGERYRPRQARHRFFETLHDRVREIHGVDQAGGISALALTRNYAWTDFIVEGFGTMTPADQKADRMVADLHIVTTGYFESMEIPLIAGRALQRGEGSDPPVVLVNRAFATRFWEPEEAVGKWIGRTAEDRMTIIGVVDDVRHYGLDADARPAVFYPHPLTASRTLYTVVRTGTDPRALVSLVTDVVRRLDPTLPIYDIESMSERLAGSLARQRVVMTLLNLFTGIALVLAVVGLYGVLSFTVATQTREIGIRRALGAQRLDLYRMVFRGAATVTALGLLVGLVAAFAAARTLEGLVWGVTTADPQSFIVATALVGLVAFASSLLPARRAVSVNPIEALRED